MRYAITVAAVAAMMAGGVARAQDPPRAEGGSGSGRAAYSNEARVEKRLLVGLFTGGGTAFDSKDDCELSGCLAVDAQIGRFVTPRLALLLDASAMSPAEKESSTAMHHVETIAARLWALPRLWLEVGAGIGSDHHRREVVDALGQVVALAPDPHLAPAAVVAAGFEIVHAPTYTLDVQLRAAGTIEDAHHTAFVSAVIGFTWY